MKRTTAALLCSMMILALVGSGAPPAHAQPFAAVHFSCVMRLSLWPLDSGSGGDCSGEVTGAGILGGQQIDCVPSCPFGVRIDSYSQPCPVPEVFPMVGFYEGTFSIDGYVGTFNWLRVGTKVYFMPPGTMRGHGVFVLQPPFGSCGAPMPLSAHVHGQFGVI